MRLFLALTLPEEARDALSDMQDRLPDGRMVPVDNMHMTLVFLGDLSDDWLEVIHDGLSTLRAPPIFLSFAGGQVYGGRREKVIAVGADGGPALGALHDRIRSRLRGAGLVLDRRRFRPHVTLMRTRDKGVAGRAVRAVPPEPVGPFRCESFGLFSSVLHQDGAIHEERARYPLDGPPE